MNKSKFISKFKQAPPELRKGEIFAGNTFNSERTEIHTKDAIYTVRLGEVGYDASGEVSRMLYPMFINQSTTE